MKPGFEKGLAYKRYAESALLVETTKFPESG